VAAALVGDDVAVEAVLAAAAAGDDDDDASVGVGGRTAVAVAGFVAAPMGDADRYVVVALEAPAAEIAMGGGEKDRLRGDRWDDGCRVWVVVVVVVTRDDDDDDGCDFDGVIMLLLWCSWWLLFGWVVLVAFSSNVGKLMVLAAVLLEPTRSGTGDVCGEWNVCFFWVGIRNWMAL
jgi:hypothetical protein